MAQKDVRLVIRAKDEAAKNIERITDALENFTDAQGELVAEARDTGAALGKITKASADAAKALNGLDVSNALASQLDDASKAVARLEKESADARDEVSRIKGALDDTAAAASASASKLAKATESVNRQTEAVKRNATAQKAAERSLKDAQAAQASLQAAQARITESIGRQQGALTKARQRFAELSAEIEKTAKPSATLQKNFAASERNVAALENKVGGLEDELRALGPQMEKAGADAEQFQAALTKANRAAPLLESSLARLKTRQAEIAQTGGAAEKTVKTLGTQLAAAERNATAAASGFEQGSAALAELKAEAAAAEVNVQRIASASAGRLDEQLVEQGLAARQARTDLANLTSAAAELRAELARTASPSAEAAQNVRLLEQRAEEANFALQAHEDALREMGAAYRAQTGDVASLLAAQDRFTAAQARLGTALDQVSNDGLKARVEMERLGDAISKGGGDSLARPIKKIAQAAGEAAPKVRTLREEYDNLYKLQRTSLGLNQRIRGEVLSMIAAYGGLFAIVDVMKRTVDATVQLESATARLNVANDGQFGETADDLDFLRRTADRLGVDIGALADQYSKFQIAAKGTNLEGERSRRVFLSVAEAGRVARLSQEDMQGVFLALTQIMSKGRLSAEELSGQLGERLPGALRIMEEGLGLASGELFKMMEQGQITADALVPFAERLSERFGPGLAEALGGASAGMGRLKNAATQALVAFGNAGFMDGFVDLVERLTEVLKSPEFISTIQRLSGVFEVFFKAAAIAAENFGVVSTILGAALGLKLAGALGSVATRMKDVSGGASKTTAGIRLMVSALGTMEAGASRGAIAMSGLALAWRGLLAATGVGLLVLGGGILAEWLTSATEVNEVMTRHREIMDLVNNAYEEAEGKVEDWAEALKGLTLEEMLANADDVRNVFRAAEQEVAGLVTRIGQLAANDPGNTAFAQAARDITDAYNALQAGEGTITDFKNRLSEIGVAFREATGGELPRLRDLNDAISRDDGGLQKSYDAFYEIQLAIARVTGNAAQAEDALLRLGRSGQEAAEAPLDPIRESTTALENEAEAAAKATRSFYDMLGGLRLSIRNQRLLNEGMDEEVAVQEAIARARELKGDVLNPNEVRLVEQLTRELFRLKAAEDEAEESAKALADAQEELADASETFKDSIRGLLEDIPALDDYLEKLEKAEAFQQLTADAAAAAIEIFRLQAGGETLQTFLDNFSPSGVVEFFTNFNQTLEDTQGFLSGIASAFGGLGSLFNQATGGIGNLLGAAGASLGSSGSRLLDLIDRTEGGGDYDTLFQHSQRPGGRYAGMRASQMTLGQLRAFGDNGYGDFVQANNPAGNYATPIGRYQIVGDTRDAAQQALGLSDDTVFSKAVQDQMAAYLAQQRLANAPTMAAKRAALRAEWEGFANVSDAELDAAITEFESNERFEPERNQADFDAGQDEASQDRQFELEQSRLIADGLAREAAVREAVYEAQKEAAAQGVTLSAERIAQIEAETGAIYDQEQATDAATQSREDALAAAQDTTDTISDNDFAIRQQELINQGLGRQAAIEEAIRNARKADPSLVEGDSRLAQIKEQAAALYDLQNASEGAEAATEEVNRAISRRDELQSQLELAVEAGEGGRANELRAEINEINASLDTAIDKAIELWEAVGGSEAEAAIASLETARAEADAFGNSGANAYLDWSRLPDLFINGLAGAIDRIGRGWKETDDKMKLVRDSFLQFAAEFLIEIGQMILKQLLFNALQGVFGGTPIGPILGFGTGHNGGTVRSSTVGAGNPTRNVSPAVFMGATRYHQGGYAGLAPGEVPIIAEEGEKILTVEQQRKEAQAKKAATAGGDTTIYNMLDGGDVLEKALASDKGQRVLVNHIQTNAKTFRSALG